MPSLSLLLRKISLNGARSLSLLKNSDCQQFIPMPNM